MGKQLDLYQKWKKSKQQLDECFKNPDLTLVIHYSCESFYDRENNPKTPRITSIAIRNLDSAQTVSFSIHLIAEQSGLLESIEEHYDALEKKMLEEYFEFILKKEHCKWLHWNMRDSNYGFVALENRLKALGGTPRSLPEKNLYDLSRILKGIYGVGYINHPRIESLMKKNNITSLDFLSGAQEAEAFVSMQFVRLHQSTLRKVNVFANFAERAYSGNLKTRASWFATYGNSIKALVEYLQEHWVIASLIAISTLVTTLYSYGHAIYQFLGSQIN
jgi:hypothetical protein